MTQTELADLTEQATILFREIIAASVEEINAACGVALEEAQDSHAGKCVLRVPFALVLDLLSSPPSFHIQSSINSKRKYCTEKVQLIQPQTTDDE